MVINLFHRIYNATSNWELFHKGLEEARIILTNNQYPNYWYENIINKTLEKILLRQKKEPEKEEESKKIVFIQYRGDISEIFANKLKDSGAPIKAILTLRKTKTAMPSLKSSIEKVMTSNVIYQYQCPKCKFSYVGLTSRHLITRIGEHLHDGEKSPIKPHSEICMKEDPTAANFKILRKTQRDILHLSVMEALFIR